jgi:hypothetical protein
VGADCVLVMLLYTTFLLWFGLCIYEFFRVCWLGVHGFSGGFVVVSAGYADHIFETLMLTNPCSVAIVV